MTETLSFPFAAGMVATVNPCGFALLPAYLARRLGSEDGNPSATEAVARALLVGAVTTVGFLLVFGTLGTAISLGARSLTEALPWAGLVIGVALAAVGLLVLSGRHLGLRLPSLKLRPGGSGLRADLLFGIGYGTASLSCTLPVFLAAIGTAFTGSLAGSVLNFVAYAFGMGTILTALAVAAALSRRALALTLARLVPYVSRLSGALLFLAGLYVVYYWTFFLLPGSETRTSGRSVIDTGGRVSRELATWLSSGTGKTAVSALLGAIAVLIVFVLWRRLARAGVESEPALSKGEPSEPGWVGRPSTGLRRNLIERGKS